MQNLDYTTLAVGQEVAVSRLGRFEIYNEGFYTVTKINNTKVVLTRISDSYVREFSVKTKKELGKGRQAAHLRAFIELPEVVQQREAKMQTSN